MNETYDILYTSTNPDSTDFMEWNALRKDLPLDMVVEDIINEIRVDIAEGIFQWAYCVVRHGEGGNII